MTPFLSGVSTLKKGVLEIVDIWQKVTKLIPKAQLAMIGDGQLEKELKYKIKKLNLQKASPYSVSKQVKPNLLFSKI